MILKKIKIKNFRNLKDVEFEFGKHITVIAGRNGTSKTSLLGLIAQPFTYSVKNKPQASTIFGTQYKTEFSDIHKATFDDIITGEYYIFVKDIYKENKEIDLFEDDTITLPVKGRERKGEKGKKPRLVTERGRSAGKGNFFFPVIYLGLKRLIPLGEHKDKDIQTNISNFSDEDQELYKKAYKEIFTSFEVIQDTEIVKTQNKNFVGAKFTTYDSLGFSAGQDNFGQIIGAILSFVKLKKDKGVEYRGGIICIDEIESTFHPSALKNLIKWLFKKSKKLQLQIILTTHSLSIINQCMNDTDIDKYSKVIYCEKDRKTENIIIKTNINYEYIESEMSLIQTKKQVIFCEDIEAKMLIDILTKDKYKVIPSKSGDKELRIVAKSKIIDVFNFIIIYDGDCKTEDNQLSPNELKLVGLKRPEDILFDYMYTQLENTEFWNNFDVPEIYFNEYTDAKDNRDNAKNFFKHVQKTNPNMIVHAYNKWKEENTEEVDKFNKELQTKIDNINKQNKKKT